MLRVRVVSHESMIDLGQESHGISTAVEMPRRHKSFPHHD